MHDYLVKITYLHSGQSELVIVRNHIDSKSARQRVKDKFAEANTQIRINSARRATESEIDSLYGAIEF